MGPEGTNSQDEPTDSEEPIQARLESEHRRIVNFFSKELATGQEPSRIREGVDPLPEEPRKRFADGARPDGLRAVRPSLDGQLGSLGGEHRRVLKQARRGGSR
jgi:hypothetical protein